MRTLSFLVGIALTLSLAAGQEPPLPPAPPAPALVLDPGGPAAPVTALAFSPDGTVLYAGGSDKLVRRFALAGGKFAPGDPAKLPPLRVPIGLGNAGAVNAVAVSPDGKWVAVAGRAPFRDEALFGQGGLVAKAAVLTAEQRRDVGVVYLFDPANPGGGRVVRGTAGAVRALTFARPNPAGGPVLVTAGREWTADGKHVSAVRVFDAATGKDLAARTDLPAVSTIPGLAVWPAGGGLRVAVAWPQPGNRPGRLVVWDVAANQTQTFDDGAFNRALALRLGADGSPRELWSGGFHNPGGADQGGRLTVRPVGQPAGGRPIAFPPEGTAHFLPRLVAAGGDTVAVVVEPSGQDKVNRSAELRLLAPDGATRGRVRLAGMVQSLLPVVTVSPDGRWVAVGGFADHRIEVYRAAGPLTPQRLPGAAGGYGAVSFLTGDKLWAGGATETPARGGLVFDFRARTAGPSNGKAAPDAPAGSSTGWNAGPGANEVTVPAAGRAFTLRDGERPDAAAYLPAGVPWAKGFAPVVAVAHTEPGAEVSLVTLFDVKTGRRLRQLSGPLQPIRALAFSGTRPLLAGVGDDPTVFVWALRDLGRPPGAIEGLVVTTRGGAVVVESIAADSPARGKLTAGDVIAAVGGPDGDLKAVTRADQFGGEVVVRPEGGTVRVQVKGAAAPVVLPVGRGVGQRGPFFMLWAGPADGAGPREWVGWSPAGPYDASSPAAEDRIGWLGATGDPARPTTFAAAGQYRKQYYRRGVLEQFVEKGELAAALAALPPPQAPSLVAELTPVVNAADGTELVRDPTAKLDVTLLDPDEVIPLERAVLRWRGTSPDGQPDEWQPFPFPGRSATLDLAKHPWVRGTHTFEVELRESADASAPAVTTTVRATFVPPPPKLIALRVGGRAVQPGEEVVSDANTAAVSADVEPGPGGAVEVTLTTSGPGGEKPQKLAGKDGKAFGPLAARLTENETTVIRVTAAAEKAGDFARHESDAAEFRVKYVPKPPPVPPPGLRLSVVTPHEPPAAAGGPLVVEASEVTLTAAVKAEKPIDVIEWNLDDGKGWVRGTLDPKARTATAAVKPFEPGRPRKVRVRARHAGGDFATDAVQVVYHPRPPAAAFGELPSAVLGSELAVGGTYSQAVGAFAAKVVVTGPRPGQSREFPATAAPGATPAAGTWRAAVALFPGVNTLGVVVRNEWRAGEAAARAEVAYRRPPAVFAAQPIGATAGGTGNVVVGVLVPEDLAPTGLVVNGAAVRADARRVGGVFGFAFWELKAADVSVKSGDAFPETVAVAAVNADGARQPVDVAVRPLPPPPRPIDAPVIALDLDRRGGPGQPVVTTRPAFGFGLRVSSGARLSRVEVWHGPQAEQVRAVKLADGATTAEERPELALREGVNRVRVVAANAGGESTAEFTVSYTPPPVRVVIDHVDEIGPGRKPLPVIVSPGGPIATTGAFLEVRGRVVWSRDDDPLAADASLEVVVSANQVVHLPERCAARAGGAKERAFKAPVYLNAPDTGVRIEVRTASRPAGLPQDGAVAEVAFACRNPLATQRLHVLVIGVAPPGVATRDADRQGLVRQVVAAVGGSVSANQPGFVGGEFKHPAFAGSVLYRPRIGSVDRTDIIGLMREVEREVRRAGVREGSGWVNDVVLVYYQGRDVIGADGRRRLHTTVSLSPAAGTVERSAVLVESLPATPGVRVVLLNVYNPDSPRPADALAAEPPLLIYPWRDPAAMTQLFGLFQRAVAERATFGGVIDRVRDEVRSNPAAALPTERLPQPVRDRRIGLGPP